MLLFCNTDVVTLLQYTENLFARRRRFCGENECFLWL